MPAWCPKGAPKRRKCDALDQRIAKCRSAGAAGGHDAIGSSEYWRVRHRHHLGEMAVKVNTHPANYGKQLLVDPNFYIGQLGELTEEFDTLIQQ